MLLRFTSTATESVMMFGDIALQLIRMMGASGTVPGAIDAAGLPAAIKRLRQQLNNVATPDTTRSREPAKADEDGEEEQQASIALQTRAQPLLDILERAAAAEVPVMWEAV